MYQKVEIFLQRVVSSDMDSTKTDLNFFCSNQTLHLVSNLVMYKTTIGDLFGYLLIVAINVLYHGKHLNFDCIEKVI